VSRPSGGMFISTNLLSSPVFWVRPKGRVPGQLTDCTLSGVYSWRASTVGFSAHGCKGCGLIRTFGECQLMTQRTVGRWFASPLIHKDFRADHSRLTRGNFASVHLNHQKCGRARMS
jgi:hypothetical protein